MKCKSCIVRPRCTCQWPIPLITMGFLWGGIVVSGMMYTIGYAVNSQGITAACHMTSSKVDVQICYDDDGPSPVTGLVVLQYPVHGYPTKVAVTICGYTIAQVTTYITNTYVNKTYWCTWLPNNFGQTIIHDNPYAYDQNLHKELMLITGLWTAAAILLILTLTKMGLECHCCLSQEDKAQLQTLI